MARDTFGLAVIGSGTIGRIRAQLAREHPGLGWLGVCDLDTELTNRLAADTQADFATDDFRDLVARPEVDAVVIATDENWHVDPILASVEQGHRLFIEKPLATDPVRSAEVLAWIAGNVRRGAQVLELGGGKSTRELAKNFAVTTVDHDPALVEGGGARLVHAALVSGYYEPAVLDVMRKRIKKAGVRSYVRVRSGEQVQLAARPVTVHRFDVLAIRREGAYVDVEATVECSSGTYVRALARDVGAALNVGGHLTALRRTRVGPYGLDGAHSLEELAAEMPLIPLADAAATAFPRLDVDARTALQVLAVVTREGRPVSEVCHRFDPVPQVRKDVRYKGGQPLENEVVRKVLEDARIKLGETGRLVIRPSGTEPVIRIMGEGDNADLVSAVVNDIAEALESAA